MEKDKIIEIYVKSKEKSDDDYEKLIGYVAAGTIVLSMSFIEKIVELKGADYLWVLILSWVALAATLVMNLISHQKSSAVHQECIADLQNPDLSDDDIFVSIAARNRPIDNLNKISSISLCVGVVALIAFCSINIYTMQKKPKEISQNVGGDDYFEKGRTVIPLKPSSATEQIAVTTPQAPAQPPADQQQSDSNNQ